MRRAASPAQAKPTAQKRQATPRVTTPQRTQSLPAVRAQCEATENKLQQVNDEVVKLREEFENASMRTEEQLQRRFDAETKSRNLRDQYVAFVVEKGKVYSDAFALSEADQADIEETLRALEETKEANHVMAMEVTDLLATLSRASSEADDAQKFAKQVKEGMPKLMQRLNKGEGKMERARKKAWDLYCEYQKHEQDIDEKRKKINRARRCLEVNVLNVHNAVIWPYDSVDPPYVLSMRREVENLREVHKMEKTGLLIALGMEPAVVSSLEETFRQAFPQFSMEEDPDTGAHLLRSRFVRQGDDSTLSGTEAPCSDDDNSSTTPRSRAPSARSESEPACDVAILVAPFGERILDCIGSLGRINSRFHVDRLVGHKNCAYHVVLLHDPVPPDVEALFPKWRTLEFARKPRMRTFS